MTRRWSFLRVVQPMFGRNGKMFQGENLVVTSDTGRSYVRRDGELQYRFVGLADLVRRLA